MPNNLSFVSSAHESIFESTCQVIVNPVNCVGAMGKGLALEFKKRIPSMYDDYLERCRRGEVLPGRPYLWSGDLWSHHVLNFPTKVHWSSPSRLRYIADGLQYLGEHHVAWGIESIAFPRLGCGLGGLDWLTVRPIMIDYLEDLTVPVTIYM